MSWFLLAILSTFANAGMFLCFKELQKSIRIELYLFYTWLISSVVIGFFYIPKFSLETNQYTLLIVLILGAGIGSWLGNFSYNLGLRDQQNLGYVEALSSSRIAISYTVSILFFNSVIEVHKIAALVCLTIGIFMVTRKTNLANAVQKNKWVLYSLISGVFFALLAIFTRIALSIGIRAPVFTSAFLFVAALFYGATSLTTHKLAIPKNKLSLLLVTGVFAVFANLFLYNSYEQAPNLAYPVAISSGRMVLLYLASLVNRTDQFRPSRGIGVILTFISVLLLS